MKRYQRLFAELDQWFEGVRAAHADQVRCRPGCSSCCHGLFDISLPDTVLLVEGIRAMPEPARIEAISRARGLHAAILTQAPELKPPFMLEGNAAECIDRITETVEGARCPLLDEKDQCLVYAHRPLACRLEGIPMVDACEGLFGDWCELNFNRSLPPESQSTLALDYGGIQELEDTLTEQLSRQIFGRSQRSLTVFIPSLLVEFDSFWNPSVP